MDLKLKIAVASGAALAGLTLVWIALPAGVRNSPETVTSVPAPRLDLAAPIVTDAADPEVHEHRSPAGEALRDDRGVRGSSTVPEVPPPRTVSGIVVDIEGSPVGNLEVVLGSPTASFFRQRRWVVSPIVPSAPRSAADSRGTTSPSGNVGARWVGRNSARDISSLKFTPAERSGSRRAGTANAPRTSTGLSFSSSRRVVPARRLRAILMKIPASPQKIPSPPGTVVRTRRA
jgi:hypothetical protein